MGYATTSAAYSIADFPPKQPTKALMNEHYVQLKKLVEENGIQKKFVMRDGTIYRHVPQRNTYRSPLFEFSMEILDYGPKKKPKPKPAWSVFNERDKIRKNRIRDKAKV